MRDIRGCVNYLKYGIRFIRLVREIRIYLLLDSKSFVRNLRS